MFAPDLCVPPALANRGISFRPAISRDRAFERALFETARPDAALLAVWPDDLRRSFLDQQFQFQTAHYARAYPHADRLIVSSGAAAIGRLILDRPDAEWTLVDIALVPEWRGRGLGKELITTILNGAGDAGATVVLTVDIHNRARALYERLGFNAFDESFPNLAMEWRPEPQLKTA
jgi:ribosomal protein S18 acetylase RimI-like enzyme